MVDISCSTVNSRPEVTHCANSLFVHKNVKDLEDVLLGIESASVQEFEVFADPK